MKNTAKLLVTLSSIAVMALPITMEFASADDHNEGKKRGRRSGALVGLTLGALTGDAKLAAAGAIAGGVTGGAAGNMQDYQNDRDDYRAETMAAAIASKDSGGQGEAPSGWDTIDNFVGNWKLSVWGLDVDGERHDASAAAVSSLNTTTSVSFRYSGFQSESIADDVSGTTTLSFSADRGFELVNALSTAEGGNRYVGHYDNAAGKYHFYYAGSNLDTFSGIQRTDYRIDMQMIGADVIVIETWATVGAEDKRIQSYRFTRS